MNRLKKDTNRLLSLLLALLFLFSFLPIQKAHAAYGTLYEYNTIEEGKNYWDSYTTPEESLKISSPQDLLDFAALVNEKGYRFNEISYDDFSNHQKYVKLTCDIDMSGYNWTPIGQNSTNADAPSPFQGIFDGAGYTISNLSVRDKEVGNAGLFGYVAGDAERAIIQNVNLSHADFNGQNTTGGICGSASNSIISNCAVSGKLTGANLVGGIAGFLSGSIENCYTNVEIQSANFAGGICGQSSSGKLSESYAIGSIQESEKGSGGILGNAIGSSNTISSCVALQSSISSKGSIGRIAGKTSVNSPNCFAWDGMKLNDKTVSSSDNTTANGANLTAAEALSPTTYTGLGWKAYLAPSAPNAWAFEPGKLPHLHAFSEIPPSQYTYLSDSSSGDVTKPVLSSGSCEAAGASYATLRFTSSELGTYYCLVLPATDTEPTESTIQASGQSGSASAGANSFSVQNLTVSTSYVGYLMVKDASLNTSTIMNIAFTTGSADSTPIPPCLNGTYRISTATQLAWFRDLVNGTLQDGTPANPSANAILTTDLDLSSVCNSASNWLPIGRQSTPYSGTFDGGFHTLSNLFIRTNSDSQALFGSVTNATIKNLIVKGSVTSTGSKVAGIAGSATNSSFTACQNQAEVSGKSYVSGIAGNAPTASFVSCSNSGHITGQFAYSGGIAAVGKTFAGCQNTAAVSGAGYVGGICGYLSSGSGNNFTVTGCSNSGAVTCASIGGAGNSTGGLFGLASVGQSSSSSTISKSYNTGTVSDSSGTSDVSCVGGLGGTISCGNGTLIMTSCYNAGTVSGVDAVGGCLGKISATAQNTSFTFRNSYSIANLQNSSQTPMGGIVGQTALSGEAKASSLCFSNLFFLQNGALSGIGGNDAMVDPCTVQSRTESFLKSPDFLTQLGGTFTMYSDGIQEVSGDTSSYSNHFSAYPHPILRSSLGLPDKQSFNVQFLGANYTDVSINGASSYASTVSSGQALDFSIASKYPEVSVKTVLLDEKPLSTSNGSYTISKITADIGVTIVTDGTPPGVDTYAVTFVTNPSNAKVTVTNSQGTLPANPDGTYLLKAGEYTCTTAAEGYVTKTGTFKVTGNQSYSINLSKGSIHTVTIDSTVPISILSDGLTLATVPEGKTATPLSLPDGSYGYLSKGYGGGSFTVSENQTLSLRKVDFSSKLQNQDQVAYSIFMSDAKGLAYTPGGSKLSDGDARARFLLPIQKGSLAYHYTFHVPPTHWGGSGDLYVYNDKDFSSIQLSDAGKFLIAPKIGLTISVPKDASLKLCHRVRFYEPLEVLSPKSQQESGDVTTYRYDAPSSTPLHYELELPGYVKKACTFSTTTADMSLTVPKSALILDSKADCSDRDYAADIVMNAPDSKYITLQSGEEFELYCFRNWQAISTESGNYYVDPNYTVERIFGNSVTIENPYYAGATVKASGNGISIVRVTYAPLDYLDTREQSHLYSKLWEQNTVLLVFHVNPSGRATIDTGIHQTEYETAYYTRSINGICQDANKQFATYTFTPSVKDGTLSSVSIHAPVGSTEPWDDKAWTDLPANADGSYTAHLKDGRSLIRVTAADGTVAYRSVKAYGLVITVDSPNVQVSLKEEQFSVQTTVNNPVRISFDGLTLPFPKLGGIYNPGFPDKTYLVYSLQGNAGGTKTELESEHTQYYLGKINSLTLSFDSPDTYTLSGGKIHTSSIGSNANMHRNVTKGGLTGSAYSEGQDAGETVNGFFCTLPDLAIRAEGTPDTGDAHKVLCKVPDDLKSFTIRNSLGYQKSAQSISGSNYTYSLVNHGSSTTYTYYAERKGYVTQVGSFQVSDSDQIVDLTSANWEAIHQSGVTNVSIVAYESVLTSETSRPISEAAADLSSKGFVLYNHGGYTVLHALMDALQENKAGFTCTKGMLSPSNTMSGTVGNGAAWVCEVNGKVVLDYANTLVNGGDKIIFYYNPATSISMRHAWFLNPSVSTSKDGSVSLTLVSTPVSNNGSAYMPLEDATVYIDGKACGTTDSKGGITLSNFGSLSVGQHTVSAQKTDSSGKNTLTFTRAILTVTKSTIPTSPDQVTVTFRLIGDTIHPASHKGYMNWIKTKTYTLDKGSTMESLFKKALAEANMTYDNTSDNYVSWICAPSVLGGYKLSEFSNGRNSGWMYTVDGTHPNLGICEYVLKNGNEVIWHYVNDYTLETTYKESVAKYVNPWLTASDVNPNEGMLEESKKNVSSSFMPLIEPNVLTLTPDVTVKDGKGLVTLSSSSLQDAIKSAKKEKGSTLTIAPIISGSVSSLSLELPSASLSTLSSETDANVTLQTPLGNITLPNAVLASISAQASGSTVTVSLELVNVTKLNADQQKAIGSGTVYDISVVSGNKKISSFSGSSLSLSLPYTLKPGENPSGVTVWYMDSSGKLQQMTACYDKKTGLATFATTHLSYYLVGYTNAWENPYLDVASSDWFYGAVRSVSQNKLMSGISKTHFAPDATMTRAMLVTALYRMEGKPKVSSKASFLDVQNDQWYTDAVLWANETKIACGYGSDFFGANDSITREQLATMLLHYASYKKLDSSQKATLSSYQDASDLYTWAILPMQWSVAKGLITGTSAIKLSPKETATRAQVATILMRLSENVLN